MQEKTIIRNVQIGLLLATLAGSQITVTRDIPAYIPQDIRHLISNSYKAAESSIENLRELDSMIRDNRVIASRDLVSKALDEAQRASSSRSIKNHLRTYRDSLKERWTLLALEGSHQAQFMIDTVSQCVDATALDIMRLSTELAERNNIDFCGDCKERNKRKLVAAERISPNDRTVRPSKPNDPSVIFNADMMTNINSGMPSIIFATGINSPVINAWPMAPSFEVQSPVNIQMPMPGDIKDTNPISLELHFLVRQEAQMDRGIARIEVKSVFLDNNEQFNIFENPQSFQFVNYSNNFSVLEPTDADSIRHVRVIIPLENMNAKRGALALFSIQRAELTGTPVEYEGNLYLAAAAFKYTEQ